MNGLSVYRLQFQNYSDGLSLSVCCTVAVLIVVCVDPTHDHVYCKRKCANAATGPDSAGVQSTNENDSAVQSTNENDSAGTQSTNENNSALQSTNENDSADIQSTNESHSTDEASQFSVGSLQSTSDVKLRFAQSKIRRLQREVKLYN